MGLVKTSSHTLKNPFPQTHTDSILHSNRQTTDTMETKKARRQPFFILCNCCKLLGSNLSSLSLHLPWRMKSFCYFLSLQTSLQEMSSLCLDHGDGNTPNSDVPVTCNYVFSHFKCENESDSRQSFGYSSAFVAPVLRTEFLCAVGMKY